MSTYLLLTPNEDELYHHGILGQKWGIRRFQPYQPGAKVKGGKEVGKATKVKQRGSIVEHFKAKRAASKKAASIKKAQKTRKANIDYEAAKKKAIESGTAEDLAKFKGKLTNEEYTKAFLRLQNEKKLADMVAANQKSVWDTIDSGMKIVERVGKYAGTVATAKENFTRMQDALNKNANEDKKEKAAIEKNKFLTNIENITELNEGVEKHKITPQEYQQAMNILANKKARQTQYGDDFEDQNKKAAKEQAAKEQSDRDRWSAEQSWKQYQKAQEKERKRQAKEAWKKYNEPKDGEWWKDEPSSKSTDKAEQKESKTSKQSSQQLRLSMRESTPPKEKAESGKRIIKGFNNKNLANSYSVNQKLEFGDSSITRAKAKSNEPTETVRAMRKTVHETALESARQKEIDKKRRARLG